MKKLLYLTLFLSYLLGIVQSSDINLTTDKDKSVSKIGLNDKDEKDLEEDIIPYDILCPYQDCWN